MTLVEVMIAMVILLIGVLGTLTLVQGSMSSTSATTAREQATNLARDLIERSRQADYADMTYAGAPATLRSTLAADSPTPLSGSTFTVTRRNVDYEVTVFACSIDDPTDGAGAGDATFCAAPVTNPVPGDPDPGLAAAVNVLGIEVSLGGTGLTLVCNALGLQPIGEQLTAQLNPVAPVSVCPTGSGTATVQYDSRPDDLRRVRVTVKWTRGGTGAIKQTTLLTNPLQS